MYEDERGLPLRNPTNWPDESILPNFKNVMMEYMSKLFKIASKLRKISALSLNLDENYFEKKGMFDKPLSFLRLWRILT